MERTYDAEGLAQANWQFNDSKTETIAAGAAVYGARQLEQLNATMTRIERLLLSLGVDGLHEVIRHHRAVIRKRARKASSAPKV